MQLRQQRGQSLRVDPSGAVTDGTFSGHLKFRGFINSLQVALDATARSLDGHVSFIDALQSYDGTLRASISGNGSISGGYSAVGASTGGTVSGTVSGVTDNQSACGIWKKTADQDGTWELTRVEP
jgi:hypothetical protein